MDLSLKINNYETGLWCYKNLIHKYFTHSINYKVFFSSLQLSSLFGYNSSYKSLNNCYFHLINDIPSIYNSVIIKQTFKTEKLKIDLHSLSFRWERGSTVWDWLILFGLFRGLPGQ